MQRTACWQVAAPVYVFHPICLTFLWYNKAACVRYQVSGLGRPHPTLAEYSGPPA